ncbi:MAG: substrate-binding domain-containing protein [Pseudomonadota bacterium]
MSNDAIRLVLPVALKEVFDSIAPTFTDVTGHRFHVELMLNPEVPAHIASGAAWSIALSNPQYIQAVVDAFPCDGGVQSLGYAPLCLAVNTRPNTSPLQHPREIASVLVGAETIALTTGGTSSAQFARLAESLGITKEMDPKLRWLPGGGPAAALRKGDVDIAVLPLTNVASVPGLYARAICPLDMDVQVDLAFCVSARATVATRQFAEWLIAPELDDRMWDLGVRRNVAER